MHAGQDIRVLRVSQDQLPLGRQVHHARLQRLIRSICKACGGHHAASRCGDTVWRARRAPLGRQQLHTDAQPSDTHYCVHIPTESYPARDMYDYASAVEPDATFSNIACFVMTHMLS